MSIRFGSLAALLLSLPLQAAEIPLYPTGPSEDSSFLRFVNGAGEQQLQVEAKGSKARLEVNPDQPVSAFLTVPAGRPIQGQISYGKWQYPLDLQVEPGEFVTLVSLASAGKLELVAVREQPDDFNALKASLALFNLDQGCSKAGLKLAERSTVIFLDVDPDGLQRRSINPLPLKVQATCNGQSVGEALDLGTLQAGERYSLLLLPSANGPRLIQATDSLSH